MEPRDPELDEMLESLRTDNPTTAELKTWTSTIPAQFRYRHLAWTALAAGFIGVVIGGAVTISPRQPAESTACSSGTTDQVVQTATDATFELSYVNLD